VSKNKAARRSFWLIVTRSHGRMEVLTIDAGGETVLPLFSFQEEGEFFLGHQSASVASRLRETTTGELVSLLLGLCARVDKVALDPLPSLGERGIVELVSTGRRHFVRDLLGEVTAHSERDKPTGCERGRSDPTRLWKGRTGPAQSVARQ
jgi:hypothetical protein